MVWSCHPKEVDKKTHEWPLVGFLFCVNVDNDFLLSDDIIAYVRWGCNM